MQVLIVDDDAAMREALCETLELQGHQCVTVSNGREALDFLRESKPCVILLDLMMPFMNGWEFRAAQLKDPRVAGIPVLVISAHLRAEKDEGELAAAGYLSKPLSAERLLKAVAEWCTPAA
ncbi:MAG: response regulator [Acidobacteriota bacterium]